MKIADQNLAENRNCIPFAKVGRRIYYQRADLDAFVAARVGVEPNTQRRRQEPTVKTRQFVAPR